MQLLNALMLCTRHVWKPLDAAFRARTSDIGHAAGSDIGHRIRFQRRPVSPPIGGAAAGGYDFVLEESPELDEGLVQALQAAGAGKRKRSQREPSRRDAREPGDRQSSREGALSELHQPPLHSAGSPSSSRHVQDRRKDETRRHTHREHAESQAHARGRAACSRPQEPASDTDSGASAREERRERRDKERNHKRHKGTDKRHKHDKHRKRALGDAVKLLVDQGLSVSDVLEQVQQQR
jgi:hypothetical protein